MFDKKSTELTSSTLAVTRTSLKQSINRFDELLKGKSSIEIKTNDEDCTKIIHEITKGDLNDIDSLKKKMKLTRDAADKNDAEFDKVLQTLPKKHLRNYLSRKIKTCRLCNFHCKCS
jgi:hypothetical protein